MPKIFLVYLVTNSINGKRYVGKTSASNAEIAIKKRWRRHLYDARRGKGWLISRAIRKYGPENFVISVRHTCEIEPDAFAMEILEIAQTSPEYNSTKGGEGVVGYVRSPEQRKRMGRAFSIAMLGKPKTAEHARNISLGKKGKPYKRNKFTVAEVAVQAARATGLSFYSTGTPCKRGHIAPRYTSSRQCTECHRQWAKHYANLCPRQQKRIERHV